MTSRQRTLPFLAAALCLAALPVAVPGHDPAQQDAPEISRSAGAEGGVVVLWPRIIPGDYRAASREDAAMIQNRLLRLVQDVFPGRPVDVRPEPERVCGQAGCNGISVGAVILRDQGGVAVLALVSEPGRSAAHVIPWTGVVDVRRSMVPFREPPESSVRVRDFGLLHNMESDLSRGEDAVRRALREAAGGS